MPKLNSSFTTLLLAACVAAGVSYAVLTEGFEKPVDAPESIAQLFGTSAVAQDTVQEPTPEKRWAASATGRIEPKSGNIGIVPQVAGQVDAIVVSTNTKVKEGDLLVELDADQYRERIRAAEAEESVRVGERGEEPAEGAVKQRQDAEDAVFQVETQIFNAWRDFDAAFKSLKDGKGSKDDVQRAREKIASLESELEEKRKSYREFSERDDIAAPGRLESGLTVARSDVALARHAFEETRIRAPFDGTVLNVYGREGEIVGPNSGEPLLSIGDLSSMRVRAEVEERDVDKVRMGQKVLVRADAYPNQEFEGTVTEVASALGSPRIASRGPRRPNDVDVLEVVADLDGSPPLLTGMRVDVFFLPLEKNKQTSVSQ